jgi:DNA-binding CsgD family transcriptional regulator
MDKFERPMLLLTIALAGVGGMVALDLVLDWRAGGASGHLVVELLAASFATIGAAVAAVRLVRAVRAERGRAREERALREAAERRAEASAAEAGRWRAEASELLGGLGAAIDQQFRRWGLTPAEAEVALLLLKGLSTRDIAGVRGTSERTTREQARRAYAKAGVAGRAELSAFFLEDLMLPVAQRAPSGGPEGGD